MSRPKHQSVNSWKIPQFLSMTPAIHGRYHPQVHGRYTMADDTCHVNISQVRHVTSSKAPKSVRMGKVNSQKNLPRPQFVCFLRCFCVYACVTFPQNTGWVQVYYSRHCFLRGVLSQVRFPHLPAHVLSPIRGAACTRVPRDPGAKRVQNSRPSPRPSTGP